MRIPLTRLNHLLLGRPLATEGPEHERLRTLTALAVVSSPASAPVATP